MLRNVLAGRSARLVSATRNDRLNRAAGRAVETLEGRVFMHAGHVHDETLVGPTAIAAVVQPLAAVSGTLAVSAASPTNGAKGVAVASNVTVTFNSPVTASSVNANTIQLRDSGGGVVAATVTYNPTTRVATLDPSGNLAANNNYYTATVKGGASGVLDAGGNFLANDFTFSFTTGTPQFTESTVFSGLTAPTQVKFAPNGKVFVAERSGVVKEFDSLTDTTATVVADIRASVHNFWDRGLLGMALDPNFTSNGYIYLLYTYDGDVGQNNAPKYGTTTGVTDAGPDATGQGAKVSARLTRITVNPSTNVMVSGSELVLIHDWAQQFPSHSIGSLQFGPEGALYASGGDGASFNFVDYGQIGNPFGDPANEGGALRSQDIRSNADATGLDGTVIRINPANGAPWPTNPLAGDTNARRIIANGLRNPMRITFRPGTSELWVGDVGWNEWEEINRIVSTGDSVAENFGWPAYEGAGRQAGYDAANLPLLEAFYAAGPAAHNAPYYTYRHSEQVVPGSGEPTGGSSVTGVAFYDSGSYPSAFKGALFFADYSRKQLYVMYAGPDGLPDPSTRQVFKSLANGAVELTTGPGGDLYYVNMDAGKVQRFQYAGAPVNRAPSAVITANTTGGAAPLTVQFSAAASTDPDAGDTLSYSWDLDGNGTFGDSTAVNPTFTYATAGNRTVQLRVTDSKGASDTKSIVIFAGNTAPVPTIAAPLASLKWKVGDTINFSGSASDAQDGTLAASKLTWTLSILHDNLIDPSSSHTHKIQDFVGVSSGSFVAPDHEYPSRLELKLTATDAQGVSTTTTTILSPQATTLNFGSSTPGLTLSVGGQAMVTPFSVTTIAGSNTSVSAPSPQTVNGVTYTFANWSDGGAQTHNFLAPAAGGTYTANFTASGAGQTPFGGTARPVPGTIQAEDFDNGGEGVAFHDADAANSGGNVYRTSAVDVAATADTGGGYQVGWAKAGEWLEYTVNVATAGQYTLDLRYAAATGYGGQVHVEFDGVDKSGAWLLNGTGGWSTFKTATKTVTLAAGTQVMRLALDWANDGGGSLANFNWLKLTAVQQPSGQTPYGGTPIGVPGVIEAENFDEGGASVVYNDSDAGNNGGDGRATDVDMELTSDPAGGGLNLSHTRAGEWLEYTINVPTAGAYTLEIRLAADAGYGGVMHVEFGGVNKTGAMPFPETGGWQNYQTVSKSVTLAAGVQVMRLAFDSANNGGDIGNVNWLKLSAGAVTPPAQTPFGGAPINVPNTIQAEDFDNGGEGVSFHDVDAANTGGVYRSTAVDLQSTSDVGGGFNVGWVKAGEWLEYTINVATAGNYALDVRHAAAAGYGGEIHVEFDGVDKTGAWTIAATGGWQTFATSSRVVSLSAGTQVMRVSLDEAFDGGGSIANLNWFRLTAVP